jgi:hypothetical protein
MDTFNLNLKGAMIFRIFYCIPFLLILNMTDWARFTFISYIGIYLVLVGIQ